MMFLLQFLSPRSSQAKRTTSHAKLYPRLILEISDAHAFLAPIFTNSSVDQPHSVKTICEARPRYRSSFEKSASQKFTFKLGGFVKTCFGVHTSITFSAIS
jgi:hypothetical protein